MEMNEHLWKICFFAMFLIWTFVRRIYGIRAMKTKSRKTIKQNLDKFLILLNMIGFGILPLMVVFSPYLDPFKLNLPESIRLFALIVSFLNIIFFAKIHKDLGNNWSANLEIKEDHKLITEGIYKKIRHPMYSHLWLWAITQGIILGNWIVLIFGIIFWAIFYFIRVPQEEALMIEEFDNEYKEYMKKTGRLFPKIV